MKILHQDNTVVKGDAFRYKHTKRTTIRKESINPLYSDWPSLR